MISSSSSSSSSGGSMIVITIAIIIIISSSSSSVVVVVVSLCLFVCLFVVFIKVLHFELLKGVRPVVLHMLVYC